MDERDETTRRRRGPCDTTGGPVHDPAFPAWRALGLGWLADRLYRRHDTPRPVGEQDDAAPGEA